MKAVKNKKNRFSRILRATIMCSVLVILVGFAKPFIPFFSQSSKHEVTTTMVLEKILSISDLSTIQTTYNSMVQVDDIIAPHSTLYYVSYEAVISAGIDFSDVNLVLDHDNKTLEVTLPESEIQETNVDIASLDFLFRDTSVNTANLTPEAYKLCQKDVEEHAKSLDTILELSTENAISIITALTLPFMDTLGNDYELIFA